MYYKQTTAKKRLINLFAFLLITVNALAQEYVSLSTDIYRPDDIKKDWVFDYKHKKENISIILKSDSVYIDEKHFRLSKIYDIKESDNVKMERYYAYSNADVYYFDVFSSKKSGEENMKYFYLTIDNLNVRFFCVKRV